MNQLAQVVDNSEFVKAVKDGEYISLIKNKTLLKVTGIEELSVGEGFNLFFKEFSLATDRKLATFSGTVHKVDIRALRNAIEGRKIQFVKNTGVEIVVPANYTPGIANMMATVKGIAGGMIVVSSLKTEAARLYDWLKQVVKTGRAPGQFRWTISNFDSAIDRSLHFVRNLPDETRRLKVPMGQVYVNFEEMIDVIESFNGAVNNYGARDPELTAKELNNAYNMGQLLVAKIKANEISLDKATLNDIESMVNAFVELTDLAGALLTLMNEMSAVLREQIKEVAAMH